MSVDLAGIYASDPLMQAVQLGVEVQHFITHDKVGKYLIERAHQCRIAALEELAEIDPNLVREIIKLQNNARIPALFLQWLDEALAQSEAAETTIRLEEVDDKF